MLVWVKKLRLRGGVTHGSLRFRGGLVLKAHRLLYHSTLGLRVIKKKRVEGRGDARLLVDDQLLLEWRIPNLVEGVGFRF